MLVCDERTPDSNFGYYDTFDLLIILKLVDFRDGLPKSSWRKNGEWRGSIYL